MGIKTKRNENNWPTIEFLLCLYNVFKYKIEMLPFNLNTFDNSSWFLGLLGIVRGVTAMCGPPLGGLIFEKFEVKIFIETLIFNDIAIKRT